ncbi:MAG: TonB-dependent receptor, partial [Oleiphilaceae bacterium]|nr:TonB-dependent receptor [Oleiphilaceae bacterium]
MVRFKPRACYMAICLSFISLQAIAAELAESSTGTTQTTPIKSSSRSKFIEEVVVTAQKREETLSDVPIAITTFTGDMAKDLGITDTRDLSKLIPGFSHSDSGLSNPIYTLRGVGFNDASRTASSTVGIYYDEVSLPYSYLSKGPTLDIERIEVLKGPQGTLYGRNTTGGAINYITTKPTESLEYGLQGSYGSYQTYEVGGFYSTPLGETLGVRIAGRNIYATEGWQESVTRPGDRLGEKNKQAVRITTEWQPESTLNLRSNISLDYWRDKSEPLAPQAFLITPQGSGGELTLNPEVSSHPLADEDDAEQADWEPNTPWQLNDKFLMFATRNYLDVTENISMAIIGNYIKFKTDDAFIPQSGLDTNNSERQQTTDTQIFQLEIRADGSLYEERLDWVAGIFGSRDEVDEIQRQLISSSSATGNTVPGVHPLATSAILRGNQVSESIATFFNTDWAINSAAAISLGLRYTDEARDFSGCGQDDPEDTGVAGLASTFNTVSISRGGTGGADEGDCFTLDRNTRNPSLVEGRLAEDSVAGKLSLDWQVWEDQLLYLSLSRGFKSGSFPILGATEGEQYDPVVQEKVTAIELGAKTSWLDNRLKINVAAFDYDYVNKQLLGNFNDDVFGPLPKLFNVP